MPSYKPPRIKDALEARIYYRDVQNTKFGTEGDKAELMVMIAIAIWKYETVSKDERPRFVKKLFTIAKNLLKRKNPTLKTITSIYMKGAFVATGSFNKINCMDVARALRLLVIDGNAEAIAIETELKAWHDEFVKEVIMKREDQNG